MLHPDEPNEWLHDPRKETGITATTKVTARGNAVKDFLTREKACVYVVAEVVRLRAMPENDRILTNSATKILNGVRCGGIAQSIVNRYGYAELWNWEKSGVSLEFTL